METINLTSEAIKKVRAELQETVDYLNTDDGSRELSIAKTKLEEAKMWLGKHLGNIPGNVDLNAERDKAELAANDPFTSEAPAGTQKEADPENVCTSCEG